MLRAGEEPLTVDPSHTQGLKDGHEQEAHAAGCVVVKELKHIHTTLPQGEIKTELYSEEETDLPPCPPAFPLGAQSELGRVAGDRY